MSVVAKEPRMAAQSAFEEHEKNQHFRKIKMLVSSIDLSPVKLRLTDPKRGRGWTLDRANQIEQEYRNFLVLAAMSPDLSAIPSEDIDEFWHVHILFTRRYEADCYKIFDDFLHHAPSLGSDKDKRTQDAEATQARYHELFGESMSGVSALCTECGSKLDRN